MSQVAYTTTPDILASGDYGSNNGPNNNVCFWWCLIAAILGGQKADDKTFEYYLKIFKYIAREIGCNFPTIGSEVDVYEIFTLIERITSTYHFALEFLQCDSVMGLVFHDTGIKIGNAASKNKYILCLYMRHFYLLKIDNLAPITEEQMTDIQTAELHGNYDQVQHLQSNIFAAHQARFKGAQV